MTATLTSTDPENDKCPACGKALSLTVSPLPEEIAGLVKKADQVRDAPGTPGWVAHILSDLTAALERMARSEK